VGEIEMALRTQKTLYTTVPPLALFSDAEPRQTAGSAALARLYIYPRLS
jgi:hypothetical protein